MRKEIIIFILFSSNLFGQNIKHVASYHSPLGIPLVITANFGDLRPNHFHMGIDFSTNGVEKIPIHSILDGFVSRIKISPSGYGLVVYIDHPNGITSVYAHCSELAPEIQNVFLPLQEKLQLNDINIILKPTDMPVSKGQQIALSGNSGSSTGPHLHFELRDTKTEDALNPFLNGFTLVENFQPVINSLKIYAVDEKGYQVTGKALKINVLKGSNGYSIPNNTIILPQKFVAANAYLSISCYYKDQINSSGKTISALESTCLIENDTIFHTVMDRISFDDTRYINSHVDFKEEKVSKIKFIKLFKTASNPLFIYKKGKKGLITVKGRDSIAVEIRIKDLNGNQSKLKFLVRNPYGILEENTIQYDGEKYFLPDSAYTLISEKGQIEIKKFTFYEPANKIIKWDPIEVGSSDFPIQKPIKISLNASKKFPLEKQYIKVNSEALKTERKADVLIAESKNLGRISIQIDTIKPTISTHNFTETDTAPKNKILSWKVADGQTFISNYQLFVDDKWTPLQYDLKNKVLLFKKGKLASGSHTLKIIVQDECGNEKIWLKKMLF